MLLSSVGVLDDEDATQVEEVGIAKAEREWRRKEDVSDTKQLHTRKDDARSLMVRRLPEELFPWSTIFILGQERRTSR